MQPPLLKQPCPLVALDHPGTLGHGHHGDLKLLCPPSQAYGRDLMEAQEWCRKYMKSGNVKDLTQAWDLYYHVFRRISKQLPQVGPRGRYPGLLLLEENSCV